MGITSLILLTACLPFAESADEVPSWDETPEPAHVVHQPVRLAQEPTTSIPSVRRVPWWDRRSMFGRELAEEVKDFGLSFEGRYTHDLFYVSAERGNAVRQSRFLDLGISLDAERAFGWSGTSFYVEGYVTGGNGPTGLIGDYQVVSNIEAPPLEIVSEVWWEQWYGDESVRTKVGKIDLNTEFALSTSALEFINSSMGFSPTIFTLPTFPEPAFGVCAEWLPTEHWAIRAGVYDGAQQEGISTGGLGPSTFFGPPADLFLIGQLDLSWSAGGDLPGRLGFGAWEHTGTFERFDGGSDEHTTGTFAVLDQALPSPGEQGVLDSFAQLAARGESRGVR